MQPFVRYHGHKLHSLFQMGQHFAATYQQQLCRLSNTVFTLKHFLTNIVQITNPTTTNEMKILADLWVLPLAFRAPRQ